MNEAERLKTDLLAIIKEGQNLTEGYVEIKPGIKIRAGREREFERLCDNYYEVEFNQRVENDTDTITPVYETLTKLVNEETEEYFISKANDFVAETKGEVERFKNLVKSFNTVDNTYRLTIRNLNDLYLKRENTQEWQAKVDELNGEVRRLTENSAILTEQINGARKNVNESLIKYAEEQMESIRQSFLRTTKEADKVPALDHNYVLANDVEEYNSLYRLVLILKHANNVEDFDKLVILDDMMMVTEEQKDILTSSVLQNIKLYQYIKAPEKKEINIQKDTNDKFIEKIKAAMKTMEQNTKVGEFSKRTDKGVYVKAAYFDEYNRFLEVLKIINRANASDFALTGVWDDMVYVLSDDRNKLIELMNESRVLKTLNPDNKKIEENEKLIEELYAYLDEMANKVISYTGVANLPIKSTESIGDRAWAVIDSDFEEANRIIAIIKLLQEQKENLYPVWGIANLNTNDMPKFKRLANATKRFGDKVPNIPENEAEIDKVRDQLRDLIIKAKGAPKEVLATNGLVLASDYELYKLLEEKFKYLDAAKASDSLIDVEGALIDSKYVSKYYAVNEKIKSLLDMKTTTIPKEGIETPVQPVQNVDSTPVQENNEILASESTVSTANAEISDYVPIPDDKALVPIYDLGLNKSSMNIDFSANDKELADLKARLKALSAKSSHNENERKYFDLLSEQIEILENAKRSSNVIEAGNLKFASEEDKNKYFLSLFNMNELLGKNNKPKIDVDSVLDIINNKGSNNKGFNSIDFSFNDNKIAELKKEMSELEPKLDADELAQKIYGYLNKQVELLEKAKSSEAVIDMNGLKFANEDDKVEYLSAQANLDEILEKLNANSNEKKLGKLRKKITGIRDFLGGKLSGIGDKISNFKLASFISDHKALIKLLIAAGIGLTAVTLALPQLVPSIIFACSCNAAKYTAISAGLNSISAAIAPIAGITFAPGVGAINLGVSANLALSSFVNALAKLGMIGLGGTFAYVGIKQYNNRDMENHLKDPNVRTAIQKILDLLDKLKLERNPDLSQTNLINSQIEYEASQENLTGEGLTENEILEQLPEENNEVQEQIAEEVSAILDEQQVTSKENESKKELTKEEKIALGEKLKQASREAKLKAQQDQAKKIAEEEGIEFEEALRRIEQRAAEIKFSGSKPIIREHEAATDIAKTGDSTTPIEEKYKDLIVGSDYYAEVPDDAAIEAARKLQADEEEAERLEQQAGVSGAIPIIEVPSAEEIVNQLDNQASESVSSQAEIQTMLDGGVVVQKEDDPELLDVLPSSTNTVKTSRVESLINPTDKPEDSKTAEVISKIVNPEGFAQKSGLNDGEERELASLEKEIPRLQSILDATPEDQKHIRIPYEARIKQLNERRDELLAKKNRGR